MRHQGFPPVSRRFPPIHQRWVQGLAGRAGRAASLRRPQSWHAGHQEQTGKKVCFMTSPRHRHPPHPAGATPAARAASSGVQKAHHCRVALQGSPTRFATYQKKRIDFKEVGKRKKKQKADRVIRVIFFVVCLFVLTQAPILWDSRLHRRRSRGIDNRTVPGHGDNGCSEPPCCDDSEHWLSQIVGSQHHQNHVRSCELFRVYKATIGDQQVRRGQ